MSLTFFHSIFHQVISRWPLLLWVTMWTVLLISIVAVASLAPVLTFVNAISPSSSLLSKSCNVEGFLRIPLDYPKEVMCFPANMVRTSKFDVFLPTVFAALVVAVSAFVVRSLGLWESETDWWSLKMIRSCCHCSMFSYYVILRREEETITEWSIMF